jgi:tetratricopeptide (TPR) repeat protein
MNERFNLQRKNKRPIEIRQDISHQKQSSDDFYNHRKRKFSPDRSYHLTRSPSPSDFRQKRQHCSSNNYSGHHDTEKNLKIKRQALLTKTTSHLYIKCQNQESLIASLKRRKKPIHIHCYNKLLSLLSKTNQFGKAESLYESIDLKNKDIFTETTMIQVYAAQEKYQQAETLYESIGQKDKDIITKTTMIQVYAKQKKYRQAEKLYESIDQKYKDIAIKNTMIQIYAEQKKYREAETLYDNIDQGDKDIVTKTIMIQVFAEQGKYREAEILYEKVELEDRTIITKTIMIQTYAVQEKYREAETLYDSIELEARTIVTKTTMIQVYAAQGKYCEAETLYDNIDQKEKDIFTINTMIKIYAEQKKYRQANTLYDSTDQEDKDIVTKTMMVQVYAAQEKYPEAENLYDSIEQKEKNIFIKNAMIKVYAAQGKYRETENLYDSIDQKEKDIITKTTMIQAYAAQRKYREAENLYDSIDQKEKDIFTKNTMIQVYAKQEKIFQAEALYENIDPQERNIITYIIMSRILLNHFNLNMLADLTDILSKMTLLLSTLKYSDYLSFLSKTVYRFHQLLDCLPSKIKPQRREYYASRLEAIKNQFYALLNDLYQHVTHKKYSPSLRDAWLIHAHLQKECTPVYTHPTADECNRLQNAAWEKLNHPPTALNKNVSDSISIAEVNIAGKKIRDYIINDSIYHELGIAQQFGSYIIVKFDRPMKASKIPLYITFDGEDYRTDILGGSKLKAKMSSASYGGMIAVPLAAGDYFTKWFTNQESFWYGQRAFLPEEEGMNNIGSKGEYTVGVIPDELKFPVFFGFLTLGDGCGFVKKSSIATAMGIKQAQVAKETSSFTTYQAWQHYPAATYREVVKEWMDNAAPKLQAYKNNEINNTSSNTATQLHGYFLGNIPKVSATILPAKGNKVIFPALPNWLNCTAKGAIIGRNPYSAKVLQTLNPEDIDFSTALNQLVCFQYTLTGYSKSANNNECCGHFFKGILVVLEDNIWPQEFADCNILVSTKDQKLSQSWSTANDRSCSQQAKSPERISVHGVLVRTKTISQVAAVPAKIAKKLNADYDGDEIDKILGETLPRTMQMVAKESQSALPNPKLPKTFTPRESIGNYKKMVELRQPLLERFTTIANLLYYLSLKQKQELAVKMAKTHILKEILGSAWKTQLGIELNENDDLLIMQAEIQVGLKCGEDRYKTTIPCNLVLERAKQYEKELSHYHSSLSVPYGRKLKEKLEIAVTNNNPHEKIAAILQPALQTTKGTNIVDKVHRSLIRFFSTPSSANKNQDEYISNDDEEEITLSTT